MNTNRRDFVRLISGIASVPIASRLTSGCVVEQPRLSISHDRTETASAAEIRSDFPALHQRINGFPLVYLDSAASTHRPRAVIDATSNFYLHDNANPSVSLHTLARRCATLYEAARHTVAGFIHARYPDEIIWTRGTTEAINLAASSWGAAHLLPGDEILLTQAEHYSNLLPWRFVAARTGARLRFLEVDARGNLRCDQLKALLSRRTKMVAFSHVSNVLGHINPVSEICERAHRAGAMVLIDAAQSVPHIPVDVQTLGCDFLAFSGHKMTGPMGIGVLWARRELLDALPPYQSGSNMAHEWESVQAPLQFAEGGRKFEAGTPNVAGAVGLAAAIVYLESNGLTELWKREQELSAYALECLRRVPGLRILGSASSKDRISVFSFVLENFPVPDVVRALDERGIAIRGGDLAALPLLKLMGVTAAARASCYVYTQRSDIDALAESLCDLTRLPA
jgi:cysteine desulfurase/selenocysteine lyase